MKSDPIHRAAAIAVMSALKSGRLVRSATCEACGCVPEAKTPPGIHLHHHDYNKPLDVIPLCVSCHRAVHGGSIPEPRTGRIYRQCHAAEMKIVRAARKDARAKQKIADAASPAGRRLAKRHAKKRCKLNELAGQHAMSRVSIGAKP